MFGLIPEDSIRMRCGFWSQWKWQLADIEVATVCSEWRGLGWELGEVSIGSGYSDNGVPLGRVFNLPDPQFPHAENESSWPLYIWDSLTQKFWVYNSTLISLGHTDIISRAAAFVDGRNRNCHLKPSPWDTTASKHRWCGSSDRIHKVIWVKLWEEKQYISLRQF